jgi:hypothetical protein
MEALSTSLSVLTGMITPAVLISACGALILSTSMRLGRVVDRVRTLSDKFEEMAHTNTDVELRDERQVLIFDQLDKLTSRARLLQRSITAFYSAVGIFVATSAMIGMVTLGKRYHWIPVALTWSGMSFLLYGSVLLILEARLALAALHAEMDFLWKLGQKHAPSQMASSRRRFSLPWTDRK